MVWPFSSQPTLPAPQSTSDGAFIAPDKRSRTKCWAARDEFFACLDRNGIIDSLKESEAATRACGGEDQDLRRECAESWVKYFKQRRVFENKKSRMLEDLEKEGAEQLPEGTRVPQGTITETKKKLEARKDA